MEFCGGEEMPSVAGEHDLIHYSDFSGQLRGAKRWPQLERRWAPA